MRAGRVSDYLYISAAPALALALGACDANTVAGRRSLAELACLDHGLVQAGVAHVGADGSLETIGGDNAGGDAALTQAEPRFRFVTSGQFVVDYGTIVPPPPHAPFKLACTGDFNGKTLTSVQTGGVIRRPAAGAGWSF